MREMLLSGLPYSIVHWEIAKIVYLETELTSAFSDRSLAPDNSTVREDIAKSFLDSEYHEL